MCGYSISAYQARRHKGLTTICKYVKRITPWTLKSKKNRAHPNTLRRVMDAAAAMQVVEYKFI